MACEICGRGNCTRSFHSFEDQSSFDDVADRVKDRIKSSLSRKINGLHGHWSEDKFYIELDDVIKEIEDID